MGAPEGDSSAPSRIVRWSFALSVVIWTLAYLMMWRRGSASADNRDQSPIFAEWFMLLAGWAVMLASAPFGSNDVFLYLSQASGWRDFSENPYLQPPSQNPENPFANMSPWSEQTALYGPIGVLIPAAIYLPGGAVWGNLLIHRLFGGACLAAALVLGARMTDKASKRIWLLTAANPLLLIEIASAAHSDSWIAVLLVGALLAAMRGRWGIAIVCFAATVWIKYTTVVLAPAFVACLIRRPPLSLRMGIGLIVGVIVTVLGSIVLVWFCGGTEPLLRGIAMAGERHSHSIGMLAYLVLETYFGTGYLVVLTVRLTIFAVAAMLAYDVRVPGDLPRVVALTYILAWTVGVTYFQPWYLIPLAALLPLIAEKWLRNMILVFTASAVIGGNSVLHLFYDPERYPHILMALVIFAPVAALIARHWREIFSAAEKSEECEA
jgi:hypothetical protein